MPAHRLYNIPREVLDQVAAKELSCAEAGRLYGCSATTVRWQVKTMDDAPADRASSIDVGRGGDEAFAKLIGDQKFTDVRLRQSTGPIIRSGSSTSDRSYTGCAAGMCAI